MEFVFLSPKKPFQNITSSESDFVLSIYKFWMENLRYVGVSYSVIHKRININDVDSLLKCVENWKKS